MSMRKELCLSVAREHIPTACRWRCCVDPWPHSVDLPTSLEGIPVFRGGIETNFQSFKLWYLLKTYRPA